MWTTMQLPVAAWKTEINPKSNFMKPTTVSMLLGISDALNNEYQWNLSEKHPFSVLRVGLRGQLNVFYAAHIHTIKKYTREQNK